MSNKFDEKEMAAYAAQIEGEKIGNSIEMPAST